MDEVIEDSGVALEGELLFRKLTPAQWRQLRIRRVVDRARCLNMANRKGGAAKTTTTVNLGAVFALWGALTRLVDGDSQMASSSAWLPPADGIWKQRNLLQVFTGEASLDEVTYPTSVENLSIVPSMDTLAKVEIDRPVGSDTLMRAELATAAEVDLNLGDMGGNLGTMFFAMMGAATDVMLMTKVSGLDHIGTAEILNAIGMVRKRINPDLRISAVTIADTDGATKLSRKLVKQYTADYPDAVIATVPHSVRVGEAPFAQQPLMDFAPENPVTLGYFRLAAHLVPRLGFEWVIGPNDVLEREAA